jgi:hypothetical protein
LLIGGWTVFLRDQFVTVVKTCVTDPFDELSRSTSNVVKISCHTLTPLDPCRIIALMAPNLSDDQLRQLIDAGLSQREMSRRTGIPRSTLQKRLNRLGLQVTPAAPASQVTPTAPTTPAAPAAPAAPAVTFVAVPEMQELLSLVKDLHARVEAMEQTRVPPALPAAPVPPASERKDVQQWTIRLSKALIDHLKAVAYERRIPPSQLIEELVWQALHSR